MAAHGIGKLLAHLGEDNVLWGTDSIWYGSPQDQIQAFRTSRSRTNSARPLRISAIDAGVRAKVSGARR
jgi:hypothetical protein